MNAYFVRYKVNGQLIQDMISADSPEAAIRIVAMYREIPEDEVYIYAWRDAYGNIARMKD